MAETRHDRRRTDDTTTELHRAAQDGDQAAWDELIRRYGGVVRGTVASFRLNEHDAADAAQNTWLRLLTSGLTVRDPEKLAGWLATTARRECLRIINRARPEIASDTVDVDRPAAGPTPEASVITDETHQAVRTAVEGLHGRAGQLIDALFFQPFTTYAQLSQRTGMPIGSIGPTRNRALQSLRGDLLVWA
jgi:RNA polymerase sigma factor (sigma-70 family)